ncbi:MaoC family dehydratase N-terminal domain-containing protein [Bosea sp. BK604]|uniref:FAS1-like dehydratase domain-containing protein n=1 Tax=Bosea sp. BK604 TaxID=2512180 RepID=UPI00104EDAC3|nr:MaoC family dehydratase N-terminal domain-containing protein [Bosea sp. BK604]TCR62552.1 acyl dehydratase [Bosea sp. BK604]
MGEGNEGAARLLDRGKQAPGLSDQQVEAARKLIGVWLRRDVHLPAIYEPISLHDIRRWAQYSVGDDNPLFSTTDYGKGSVWGTNIAPPTFLYTIDSGIVAPGLPGVQWIFAGGTFEHSKPVRVGDTISAKARLIDVVEKSGRSVERFISQVGEVIYSNQAGEQVSRYVGEIFRIPRARSGAGFRFEKEPRNNGEPYRYTDDELEEIAAAYRNEMRRGAEARYYEDVAIGEELPVLFKGPLTLVDIVGFYAGRRTVYNVLKLAFQERDRHPHNVYYSPSTHVPCHPAAGHFDVEIAREIGMPGAYDQGWQRINWAGHLMTNWAGDMGFVRRVGGRVTKPNLVGDLTKLTGKVTGKQIVDGEALVDVEWWGTNQRGEKNCSGTAQVRLPSRDISVKL